MGGHDTRASLVTALLEGADQEMTVVVGHQPQYRFFRGGEDAGVIMSCRRSSEGGEVYLAGIAVSGRFRGAGMGHSMIGFAFEHTGADKIELSAGPDAAGFYRSIGGRPTSRHEFEITRENLRPPPHRFTVVPDGPDVPEWKGWGAYFRET